jgi:hypothetical protein
MRPCSNVSFKRTKYYPFSSSIFLGSSMVHQRLTTSHHWFIFSFGSSSIGSSSLIPILLGASSARFVRLCLVLHECVCYSVRYILRQAPSCPAPQQILLLPSTALRLTAAKLGIRRLHGANGFGNRLGRTSRNACNVMSTCSGVMSTCSEKSWLPSNRSS